MSKVTFQIVGHRKPADIPAARGGRKGDSKYNGLVHTIRAELAKYPGEAVELLLDPGDARMFKQHCHKRETDLSVQVRGNRVFVSAKPQGGKV